MKILTKSSDIIAPLREHRGVFVQGGAATPSLLLDAICENADKIGALEFFHLHTHGEAPHKKIKHFKISNLFVGSNLRADLDYERIDYIPCFLSEIPKLLKSQVRQYDVALIHVSPPDQHGFCSLGVSVDITITAIKHAKLVIAQINPQMPRTHGDGVIHQSRIDYAYHCDTPLFESHTAQMSQALLKIGENVAQLIEDGSTLQMGIGAVPDAVLNSLHSHKDLGIHTEMFSNSLLPLIEKGVVNNSKKKIHPHKVVAGFAVGDKKLYDFVDDNPSILFLDIAYVNSPNVIKRNPKVVAINSAVEVDLTGQVCADSIGHNVISGVGGQIDFMRGAGLREGGKPIIAMTSRAKDGSSRLVTCLRPGAGVVTTRQHVHYVVTEYGVAYLFGKTLGERAKALINIAHPDDREQLTKQWFDLYRVKR